MLDTRFQIQLTGSLEDEEHVRLSDFIEQLKSVRETLNEIDKKISQSAIPLTEYRIVDLTHSSPSSVVLEAISLNDNKNNSGQIIDRFFDGIDKINHGSAPDDFDSMLLENFAKIGRGFRRNIKGMVFKRNGMSINVGRTFEAQIRKIVGEDQLVDGSVEGSLEMINFHHGINKFNIYPVVGPQKVTCHFPGNFLREAINSVGKYINVVGKLRYKQRDRFPYGIDVESIEIYPEEVELPTIFDLKGIAPNATGNLSCEDFVRRLRHAKK